MKRRRESREARRRRVIRNRLILAAVLLVLIIVVIIIIVSCSHKKSEPKQPESLTEQTTEAGGTEPAEPAKVSIPNEKPVHLYTMDYGTMTCNRVSRISKPWSADEDLEAFGAFFSSEESFPFSSETEAHNETWNSKETSADYKIGYELSFDVNGEHKTITILKPGDIENNPDLYNGDYPEDGDYSAITGYIGAWVYDDLHQDGGSYIHITQSEVTPDTLLTSIKLRPTPDSSQISNLKLRAFSYSSDEEFDSSGHYIGDYASEVVIEKG